MVEMDVNLGSNSHRAHPCDVLAVVVEQKHSNDVCLPEANGNAIAGLHRQSFAVNWHGYVERGE